MFEAEQIAELKQQIVDLQKQVNELKSVLLYVAYLDSADAPHAESVEANWRIHQFIERNRQQLEELTK